MGKNKKHQRQLRVQMKYVPAPDVGERLSRTIDILLRAAARKAATLEESINARKEE